MKRVRQNKILELIGEYDIDTQEELGKRLHESGFRVTQATISRDIKELQLKKTGRQKRKIQVHLCYSGKCQLWRALCKSFAGWYGEYRPGR
ncbi:MAG: hypothetical protein ACLTDT_10520 [Clostridium sp.]